MHKYVYVQLQVKLLMNLESRDCIGKKKLDLPSIYINLIFARTIQQSISAHGIYMEIKSS